MLALMAAAAWMAATGGQTYGNCLLARELKLHRELSYASIDLDASAGGHFPAGIKGPGTPESRLAVADGLGEPVGTLTLGFARRVRPTEGARIAADIARHALPRPG